MSDTSTRLLSVSAVAEQLDCSAGHIYNLIAVGKLSAVQITAMGRRPKTRVLASEVENFITRNTRRVS